MIHHQNIFFSLLCLTSHQKKDAQWTQEKLVAMCAQNALIISTLLPIKIVDKIIITTYIFLDTVILLLWSSDAFFLGGLSK